MSLTKESGFAILLIVLVLTMPVSFVSGLTISNVTAVPTATSAIINWNTDDVSTSYVNYGPTKSLGLSSNSLTPTTNHQVSIMGLSSDKTYYYQVRSNNGTDEKVDNNLANFYSFNTQDIIPPERVTGLKQESNGLTSIAIKWDNTKANDFLQYLIFRDGSNVANTSLAYYNDSGLASDTAYQYQVASMDISGNIGQQSAILEVRTTIPDYRPPVILNVSILEVHETDAKIHWVTDEPSSSTVFYGLNANLENKAENNETTLDHTVTVSNLMNDTPYYYKVVSCDPSNNCAESDRSNFKTGDISEAPKIEVSLPEWYNSNRLDISGTTDSFARVKIYVNDDLTRATNADSLGKFMVVGVSLDTSLASNKIRIVADNQVGFESFVEKEIFLDTQPPILNVTTFKAYTNEPDVILEGTVNKEVSLNINVVSGTQNVASVPKVTGLKVTKMQGNTVDLTWDAITTSDFGGYIIYRNGKKLTSYNDNFFTDVALNKSKQYTYQIGGYNQQCAEGEKSDPVTITTPYNASIIDDSFVELTNYCSFTRPSYQGMTVKGKFSETLTLQPGANIITVNATDKAGNTVIIQQQTILDTDKPVISHTNLDMLNPSYIQDVTINGNVSKKPGQKVIVNVFVNDNKYSNLVNEDGSFSVDVQLEKKVIYEVHNGTDYDPERRQSTLYASYGNAWPNNITIEAETSSGLKSDPVEGEIVLAMCGYGSWWSIDLGQATPTMLTPRLLLEGDMQIGIPINSIRWQGGSLNGSILSADVIKDVPLSDNDKGRYDLDWVQSVDYMASSDNSKGYILIKIKKLDSSNIFQNATPVQQGKKTTENLTTLDMENYLSDHRLQNGNNAKVGDCLVPGFGCFRIPLMMEISFAYNGNSSDIYLNKDRMQYLTTTQKQCWDVEIAIDKRLPTDKIPEQFLQTSIDVLNSSIQAIDSILVPLNMVKEAVFYGCAGTILIDFVSAFQESFDCEFSSALNTFTTSDGNGKKTDNWHVYDAQTGQCNKFDGDKKDACQKCEDSIKARASFENTMKWVCDRIFCPAAPTFQKYVKDMSAQYRSPNYWPAATADSSQKQMRSDCAYNDNAGNTSILYKDKVMRYEDLQVAYADYKKAVDSQSSTAPGTNVCSDLHEPTNKCCGYEYMTQWDSACLLMDELKESKCLAYDDQRGKTTTPDQDCTAGRQLWNSLAGFCDPQATQPADIIPANDNFRTNVVPGYEDRNVTVVHVAGDTGNSVWFRFLPDQYVGQALGGDATGATHPAEIGYVSSETQSVDTTFKQGQPSKVSNTRYFVPLTKYGLFTVDTATLDEHSKDWNDNAFKEFVAKYKDATGNTKDTDIKKIYNDLQTRIGVTNKDYIVDPTSGMLRSWQCACLPGMTSYLSLWKRVLEAVKICFETVLHTGDGSAGVCKAVLSIYVCDLIYDLISCFTQKFGSAYRRDYEGGVGNFFGSLVSAGDSVSKSVSNRYGDTSIWKSLFAERKIIHAVCLWAFTGTWDFDINSVLDQDISVDVQSVAFLYPCTRRYLSFNPTTTPEGLTTYDYHLGLGMVAGSRLSYSVDLVCSDDYSCNTPTGQCDCVKIGKQTYRHVSNTGTGAAERGQTIDEEVYENLKDAPFRYDKAIVSWTAEDPKKNGQVECKITDEGAQAPSFCTLDVAEGRFRCSLGFQDENYIRFYADPVLDKDSYYLGDKIYAKVVYSQRQPKEATDKYASKEVNPYTKFMQMKLYNNYGVEIYSSDYYPFNGNGQDEISYLPGYTIQAGDFRKTQANFEWLSGPVSSVTLTDQSKPPTHTDVYIEIMNDNGNYQVEEYQGPDNNRQLKPIDGMSDIVKQGNVIFNDGYKVVLSRPPKKGDVMHIRYTTPLGSTDSCTADLQHWKLKITFYDKSPDTNSKDPSAQISTYQNQQQERTVDVPVRCSKVGVNGMDYCVPGTKLTKTCICGNNTCTYDPTKTLYCNYYGSRGACENTLAVQGGSSATVNDSHKAPVINGVKFYDSGGWRAASTDIQTPSELYTSQLQLKIDASAFDGSYVKYVEWDVNGATDRGSFGDILTISNLNRVQTYTIKIWAIDELNKKSTDPYTIIIARKPDK